MHPQANDIGAYICSRVALTPATVGAGVGGAGTGVNGVTIDRFAKKPLHQSTKLQVSAVAPSLTSGNTASVFGIIEHSADDSTYAPLASGTLTLTGQGGTPTQRGVLEVNANLVGANRYVRARVTPALSASGVNTLGYAGIFAFGGGEDYPVIERNA